MFKIGDKVRMLRSSEEGIVVKVNGNDLEIETSDGFELPVLASDLVKVSDAEREYFRTEERVNETPERAEREETYVSKVSLAFELVNDLLIRPYFINHSKQEFYFILSIKENDRFLNFAGGQSKAKSETRIYQDLQKRDFDSWSKWKIQLLSFEQDQESKEPLSLDCHLKAKHLFEEKINFPFSSKEGYIKDISLIPKIIKPQKEETAEVDNPFYEAYMLNKECSIDLHADALGIKETSNQTILEQQFSFFQKELDQCIANHVMELTVIHGVGNGVLKKYIHKDLAKNEEVEWFREAQKEKFGYGATLVHFKP